MTDYCNILATFTCDMRPTSPNNKRSIHKINFNDASSSLKFQAATGNFVENIAFFQSAVRASLSYVLAYVLATVEYRCTGRLYL